MKLVVLYGPPAVGKLSVAKELVKLTGYRNFHNQLTVDLVRAIFDWGTPLYSTFVKKYRLELLTAAAKSKTPGLIITIAYCRFHDSPSVRRYVRIIKRYGGEAVFVQLICSRAELMKRVRHELRSRHSKITSQKVLAQVLKEHDFDSPVPFPENYKLDTTHLTPRQAALKINRHYGL